MTPKFTILVAGFLLLTSCAFEEFYSFDSETGTGGSMARFTIRENHLYTVDYNNLNTFDISNPADIKHNGRQNVGFGIETIFPYEDKLFLGARNGMYIFSLKNPEQPVQLSYTSHFWSYDPVVVQGNYAYVTLRSEDHSWQNQNVLQIYNIGNSYNPEFLNEYQMDGPRGLAIDGNKLFICDKNSLKVYVVSEGTLISEEPSAEFQLSAIDVIPNADKELLHVIADDGFYNYSYTDEQIEQLSKITIPFI